MGKDPIDVRDAPGFASSRLGIAIGMEAIRMVEEEVASAADIDKAMTLGYGFPMGPLKLTDLVGLDVRLAIAEYLSGQLGDRFTPPQLLRDKVGARRARQEERQGLLRLDPGGLSRWSESVEVPPRRRARRGRRSGCSSPAAAACVPGFLLVATGALAIQMGQKLFNQSEAYETLAELITFDESLRGDAER